MVSTSTDQRALKRAAVPVSDTLLTFQNDESTVGDSMEHDEDLSGSSHQGVEWGGLDDAGEDDRAGAFEEDDLGEWTKIPFKREAMTTPYADLDPDKALPKGVGGLLALDDMLALTRSPGWFEALTVMGWGEGGVRTTIFPLNIAAWVTMMRQYLEEGHRTIDELLDVLPLGIELHVDEPRNEGEGGEGWCGFLALLQARWANMGYDFGTSKFAADEGYLGLGDRLSDLLAVIETEESSPKLREAASRIGSPLLPLPRELWLATDDKIDMSKIGDISWYVDTGSGFRLHLTSAIQEGEIVSHKTVVRVLQTPAICLKDEHYFLATVAMRVNGQQLKEKFKTYVQGLLRRLKDLHRRALPQAMILEMRKKVTAALSMCDMMTPSHILVLNVPFEARFDPNQQRDHLWTAIQNQSYVLVRSGCGDSPDSMHITQGADGGTTFGIMVECRKKLPI
jgi:hypothetical protein